MEEKLPAPANSVFVEARCPECGMLRMWREFAGEGPGSRQTINIGPGEGLLCPVHPEAALEIGVCWPPAPPRSGTPPHPDYPEGRAAWRLRTYWNEGDQNGDWLLDSEPLARAQLFEYVKAWWNEEFFPRTYDPGPGATLVIGQPMPEEPEEAIRVYFEEVTAETWSIERVQVQNHPTPIDIAAQNQMTEKHLNQPRIFSDGQPVFPPLEEEELP